MEPASSNNSGQTEYLHHSYTIYRSVLFWLFAVWAQLRNLLGLLKAPADTTMGAVTILSLQVGGRTGWLEQSLVEGAKGVIPQSHSSCPCLSLPEPKVTRQQGKEDRTLDVRKVRPLRQRVSGEGDCLRGSLGHLFILCLTSLWRCNSSKSSSCPPLRKPNALGTTGMTAKKKKKELNYYRARQVRRTERNSSSLTPWEFRG